MKVRLINLADATARLRRFEAIARAAGLAFERVEAVDGATLDAAACAAVAGGTVNFYPLGPGETACFMSHRAAWRDIAASTDAFAAVLEDDLVLAPDLTLLKEASWVPLDADIVKIETDYRRVACTGAGLAAPGGRTLRRLRSAHNGSAGYIVSRACAAPLLALSERFADPVDQFLFNPRSVAFSGLTVYQLDPALCAQAARAAEVAGTRLDDPALASMLKDERRVPRPRGLRRVWREAARPLAQLRRGGALLPLMGRGRIVYRRIGMS